MARVNSPSPINDLGIGIVGPTLLVHGKAALPQEDPHGGRDHGLLLARTNSTARKHHGISCFLINMRQPGIAVRPVRQITGGEEFSEVS
jgi:hypothetical protein